MGFFYVKMMVECINDYIYTISQNVLVKTEEACRMLPIQKFHYRQAEWTICTVFDKGEISMALMLDWCKEQTNGVFAGIHGEIRSGQGCFISRKTKMYFFRPGDHLSLEMRLLPEESYTRQTSNGRGQLPKVSCFVQMTITLAYDLSRENLAKFLASNNTKLESVPWPTFANDRQYPINDCTIKFLGGSVLEVHKATTLSQLDSQSPMYLWNSEYPYRTVFYAEIAASECVKSMRLFHQLLRTKYIPWRKFDFTTLYELLKLVKYFKYKLLLDLCGVQLVNMIRENELTSFELRQLRDTELPSVIEIMDCHNVTALVQPEVGNFPSTAQSTT